MNNIYEGTFYQYHCAALNDRQVRQEVEQLLHTHLSSNLNTEVYKFCYLGCMVDFIKQYRQRCANCKNGAKGKQDV